MLAKNSRFADQDASRPSTVPAHAAAGDRLKIARRRQLEPALSSRRDDRARRADVRCPCSSDAASRSNSFFAKSAAGTTSVSRGLPSVSVPVLSTTSVSTFSINSIASAFLISTPACAPRPTPTMIDIGVASPSAHGQAMISTATALTMAWARRGSGPTNAPDDEGDHRDAEHGRNKPRRRLCRPDAWIGARLRCASRDHMHDLREHRFAADTLGLASRNCRLVDGAAGDAIAGCFLDRHRFAGDHRFVDARSAFDDSTVDRNFSPGRTRS